MVPLPYQRRTDWPRIATERTRLMDNVKRVFAFWARGRPPDTNGTPVVSEAPPVRCALVRKGGEFQITFTESIERGVRMVEMPAALWRRYHLVRNEWDEIQQEIASLDYTHRKRKPRSKAEDAECAGIQPGEPTEP